MVFDPIPSLADIRLARLCMWPNEPLPFHSQDTAAELLLYHLLERFGERFEWDVQQDSDVGFWVLILDTVQQRYVAASASTFAAAACHAIEEFLLDSLSERR